MLRMRKRRVMSKDNRHEDACDQRSDSDVKLEAFTTIFMDQTSEIVKAGKHSHTETLRPNKKKRLCNRNLKNDCNPHTVTLSKKAKISQSKNDPVNQPTEDAGDQRSDSDVKLEAFPKISMDQTSEIVKAGKHSYTDTLRHKKKKRLRNRNMYSDNNDGNPHTIMSSKKTKISQSNNDPVNQPIENVRHTKLCIATAEDSARKKKKRKVDSGGSKLNLADVLSTNSESDSVMEKLANTTDLTELPSGSSVCDLQCLEDSVSDDFASVRNELSNMPIADLLQLKERLGAKIYDEVMFGSNKKTKVSKKKFARKNKNRPMEMSSKRAVAVGQTDEKSKKNARDPRFDDLSGEFNESYFKQSYGFLSDIKLREKQKLLKMLKKTKDANKSAQLQQLVTRMTQQEKAEREREEKRRREQAWKKKERERVSQGKRPFFLKKSEKRKLELAEKFRKLEQTGKLEQFIAKKKKKNVKTEHKSLPHT